MVNLLEIGEILPNGHIDYLTVQRLPKNKTKTAQKNFLANKGYSL